MDLTGLLRAGGTIPIPLDTVTVELRRQADSSIAYSQQLPIAQVTQSGDSLLIAVELQLRSSPEQFYLFAEARGGGVVYYTVNSVVTVSAGPPSRTAPLTPTYVGPGSNADSVHLQLSAATVGAGDSVLATAIVYAGGAVVPGVPVGIVSTDSLAVRWRATGVDQAWLVAAPGGSGAITITARTPTGLTSNASLGVVAPAANLAKVSGDLQQFAPSQASQPLIVQVTDAQGQPFAGGTNVRFAVTSAPTGTTIAPASAVTDASGFAQAIVTAGSSAGSVTVTATATGLTPPAVSFSLTIATGTSGPATVTANSTVTQSLVVNQLTAAAPSVLVKDSTSQPLSGVPVTFAVTAGGGALTGSAATTNASGIATVGSWRIGQTVGTNTVTATVTGLAPVAFGATGTPTVIKTLVRDSGDAQADSSLRALPVPLVVQVHDSFSNLVTGATVNWAVTDGTVTPSSGVSDAQGRVRTVWTLGSAQATPTATASVGLVQTIFTATTLFGPPTIQLSFAGVPGVGIGLTAKVYVTLNAPAPTGGTSVALSSGNTNLFTVSPAAVTIAAGQTRDSVVIAGVSPGVTTLTGTATGFTTGTLAVDVQDRNISLLPAALNVPFNGTASLVINLPAAAPAGGVVFTVTSSNPTFVGLQAPTVTVPAGSFSANVTVLGLLPGSSTVTVNNAAYTSAFATVTTSASLDVLQASTVLNASFPIDVDIQFKSNNVAIAAPPGGVVITLLARNPACVATNSPRSISAGLVSTTATLTAATGPFPCVTYVVATAANIQPDSVQVTVNPLPGFNVPGTIVIGSGLQTGTGVSMQASNHGGTTVRVTSTDSLKLLVAPNASTAGSGFIDIAIPVNGSSFTYTVQALDGQTGVVPVTIAAPGFAPATVNDSLVAPALDVIFLPPTATVFQANTAFQVRIGYPNAAGTGMQVEQAKRFGAAPDTVTLISDSAAVGTLVTSAVTGPIVQILIQPGQSRSGSPASAGGVEFKPLAAGFTAVSASATAYLSLPQPTPKYGVTVNTPALTLNAVSTIGSGMQLGASGSLGASNHGGITVHLVVSDSSKFLLAPNSTTVGSGSLDAVLLNGNTSFNYTVQALEGQLGTATVTATAPGFSTAATTVTAVAPALDVIFLPATIASLAPNTAFQVRIGIPNGQLTGIQQEEILRAGSAGVTVTLTHVDTVAGKLFTTVLTGDTVTSSIAALNSRNPSPASAGGVEYDPASPGSDTVSATIPGFITLPTASQPITVTGQAITLSGVAAIGSGMQLASNGFLGASNHGGVTVHLVVSDSSKFLIAPNGTTLGTGSLDIAVTNGNTVFGFTLQTLEGQVGAATLTASAPGFTTASTNLTVVQPALDIIFLNTTQTTFSPNNGFQVRLGVPNSNTTSMQQEEGLRVGSPGVTASLTSSVSSVGALVTLAGSSGTGSVDVTTLNSRSPSGIPSGGIEFDPIIGGTTTVSATIPGYVVLPSASVAVTVNAPGIALSNLTVGAGMQVGANGSLGASNHGGVTVRVSSSQQGVALVAPDAATPGTSFIDVVVPNGSSTFSYYVQGVEGQTGAPAITASAPGFTDGSSTVTVLQPALDIIFLSTTTTTLSPNNAFQVRIGYPNANNTGLAGEQVLRAGGTARTATVSNSNGAVGQLFFQGGAASSGLLVIGLQQSRSPSPASAGGVEFSATGTGTATVSATIPGFLAMPQATQIVTVTTPGISVSGVTVGGGLQVGSNAFLGASNHGPLTVRVASSDSTRFLVAPNATTAGTPFIDVPLTNGLTAVGFVVQGVEGATGTATVTVSAPGYTTATATETIVQPSMDIIFLPTTIAATAANVAFEVRIGIPDALGNTIAQEQAIRFGGTNGVATIATSSQTAAQLVTSTGPGLSVQTSIAAGQSRSPTTVATGGVEFDPLTAGLTAVSVTIPGYLGIASSTLNVTVQ